MSDMPIKGSTPREKYIFAFEDGFFACLKLCLGVAIEKREINLLETAEEQLNFSLKLLHSLVDILQKNGLMELSDEETDSINKKYKKVLWEDYKLHEKEYLTLLDKELENVTIKIEDEDESTNEGDLKEEESQTDTPCCDKVMCVEPDYKKECIELQHEIYMLKRTIAGLEYALYNCIPYDDRCPKR